MSLKLGAAETGLDASLATLPASLQRRRCSFLALVTEFTRLFTQAQRQIETQHVLVAELQHRTRNLITVVQSIAHQILDVAGSLPAFEETRFELGADTLHCRISLPLVAKDIGEAAA